MRLVLPLIAVLLCSAAPTAAQSDKQVDFESEIWPILRDRCIRCHGSEKQDGGLRLDSLNGLHAGGKSGSPMVGENSDIVRRISLGPLSGARMPFEDKSLSPEQIAAIESWVEQGASWPTPAETPIPETESILDEPSEKVDSGTNYTSWLLVAALILGTLMIAQRIVLRGGRERSE